MLLASAKKRITLNEITSWKLMEAFAIDYPFTNSRVILLREMDITSFMNMTLYISSTAHGKYI